MGGAAMHVLCSEDHDPGDVEDLENMLEWHTMQVCIMYICLCVCMYTVIKADDMLSQVQQLKHLIEQSESVILINLDRYNTHSSPCSLG